MIKHSMILLGPALFLLAEVLIPGGSADPALRLQIIAENQAGWERSHQIFLVAFACMLWWLTQLSAALAPHAPRRAGAGVLLSGFAILADFGIATLQLLALEAVKALPAEQAHAVIALTSSSQSLLLFVFLPYMGFSAGFALLAWAMARLPGRRLPAALLGLAGLLLTAGGIASSKPLLIAAALALLAFTLSWVWADRSAAGRAPASASV